MFKTPLPLSSCFFIKFNSFQVYVHFLYHLKTYFPDIFRVYRKEKIKPEYA